MDGFGKKHACPSSEMVLSYIEQSIHPVFAQTVASHVAACDYCGAEMQLLAQLTRTNQKFRLARTSRISRARRKDLLVIGSSANDAQCAA